MIACGGDGTVRAVAQALAGTGVAMGLVPAGTGNLLARTLRIPTDVASGHAGRADRRRPRHRRRAPLLGPRRPRRRPPDDPADPGDRADERVFLVMAGTGLDATIMQSTPEDLKGRVGPLAYIISGLRAMRGQRARVSIAIDGAPPLRRSTRMVVVGNTGTLGGGLALMPDADGRRRAARRGEPRAEGPARLGGRRWPGW